MTNQFNQYELCPYSPDRRHGKLRSGLDRDMPEGYATVECESVDSEALKALSMMIPFDCLTGLDR